MAVPPYVLVAAAVEGEISRLRRRMHAWAAEEIGRRSVARGRLCGVPVRLMVTGPGMANAVQSLAAVIERRPPRLILQTGCAGAFRESGLGVGDVAVATEEIDAHLGIEPADPDHPPEVLPFSIMTAETDAAPGRYPLPRRWAEAALAALRDERALAETRDTKNAGAGARQKAVVGSGPFLTVSTVTATDLGAERRYRHYGACMEAMEGAGAAHVAAHYGLPLLEVRAASNLVGRRDRASWDLDLAFRRATWAVMKILKHFRGLVEEKRP